MTVAELIAELLKLPQDAQVRASVGWAADTAISDEGEPVEALIQPDGCVQVRGWLSNCGTELEIEYPEEDEEG